MMIKILIIQGFFLCKTEKPRSEFWKTQIAKFSENPVLSHKTQFKFSQNPPCPKIFQKDHYILAKIRAILANLAKLSLKFQKTQFQKCKNSVFQKSEKRK